MNYAKLFIVSLCAAALASCGGQGALTGPGGQAAAGQMQAALTQINASLGSFSFNQTPTAPTVGGAGGQTVTPNSVELAPMLATPYDSCVKETPDPTSDADGDGIAKTKTYTYNCSNIADGGGFRTSITGGIRITDKDDTKKWMLGGYRFDYDTTYHSTGPGYLVDWTDRGYFNFDKVGSSYVYDSDFRSSGGGIEHNQKFEVTYQGTWKHRVTPDGTATNVWDKGTIEFEGFFQMSGTFGGLPDAFAVTFEMSSAGLTYDYTGACTTYKSGSITIGDGSGNKTVVTYACTSASGTFNGQPVTVLALAQMRAVGYKTRLGSLF